MVCWSRPSQDNLTFEMNVNVTSPLSSFLSLQYTRPKIYLDNTWFKNSINTNVKNIHYTWCFSFMCLLISDKEMKVSPHKSQFLLNNLWVTLMCSLSLVLWSVWNSQCSQKNIESLSSCWRAVCLVKSRFVIKNLGQFLQW